MWTEKDYQTEFVSRDWTAFVVGWLVLLGVAPGFLVVILREFLAGRAQMLWALFIVPLLAGLGIWLLGLVTRIAFNQYQQYPDQQKPEEYITVTRGHILFFLRPWRVKRVSKEEAKTVRVRRVGRGGAIKYLVEVVRASGKSLALYRDIHAGQADEIALTIRRWSGVETDSAAETE